jgi:hypothetical protein
MMGGLNIGSGEPGMLLGGLGTVSGVGVGMFSGGLGVMVVGVEGGLWAGRSGEV